MAEKKKFKLLIGDLNKKIGNIKPLLNHVFGEVQGDEYHYFSQLNLENTDPWHKNNGLHFEIVYSPGAKKIKFMLDSEFPTSYESINKLKTYIEKEKEILSFLEDIKFEEAKFPGIRPTYIRSIIKTGDLEEVKKNEIMDNIATLLKQGDKNE